MHDTRHRVVCSVTRLSQSWICDYNVREYSNFFLLNFLSCYFATFTLWILSFFSENYPFLPAPQFIYFLPTISLYAGAPYISVILQIKEEFIRQNRLEEHMTRTLLAMLCQLAFLALLVATLLDLAVNVSLNSSHPDRNYYYYYGHKPFSCVIIAAETLP